MSRSASSRARSAVLAAVVVALGACDNQFNPTTTSPELRSTHDLAAPGTSTVDSTAVGYIWFDSLASKTFVIGGPESYYTAQVFEPATGVYTMQVYMVQQQVRQLVDVKGPLTHGSGTNARIDWEIQAPPASGLVPGAATVEWQLFLNGSLISTRDLGMTLVAGQSVSDVTLSANTITLGGPSAAYSATLQNVWPSVPELSGVSIQGWLVQPGNNARRAAGGVAVQCGSYVGTLPHGPCTFSSMLAASNGAAGTGTLSPGSATFEVDLVVNGMVWAQKTVPVVLQSSATISALNLSATNSNTVPLEGAAVAYAATIQNVDASLSGVSLSGFIRQGGTRRFAGGTSVSCGSGAAVLPAGTCTVSSQLTATNNSSGKGTLMSGDATFELQLMDANGAVLNVATIPVSIVEGPLESGLPGGDASAARVSGATRPQMTKP